MSDDHPDEAEEPPTVSYDESALDGEGEPRSDDTNPPQLEGESAPLSDVAARATASDRRPTDERLEDLFDRESVPRVDPDRLWDEIEGETETSPISDHGDPVSRTISKRQYCHQCEHFSKPPEVACTNEGTDILEAPSMDEFRVVNCPVVLEEEALEAGTLQTGPDDPA